MRRVVFLILCLAVLAAPGCYSMTHTVGKGAQENTPLASEKQWFALWGLIPLGHHDGGALAGRTTDYTIHTQQTAADWVINIFTGIASFTTRTVEVVK